MNIRKETDYSDLFSCLDRILGKDQPQMQVVFMIGKAVCVRPEKGAAVAAAEYIQANYPDKAGFSPRNLRRMRNFYQMYCNDPELMNTAMQVGWTLNVAIMEAELTMAERRWYLQTTLQNGWTKSVLLQKLKVKTHLEDGKMAITMEMENEDEEAWMSTYNLLTWKPVIYAANVAEGDLADDGESNSHVQAVRKYAAEQNSEIFVICAEIEEEISELDDDEKKMFLEDLGLTESGLEKLVKASYHLLGLMSFLTSGEDETRAWTIKIGTKAPQAAGKIHTDFERGFIKAEVVNYQDLLDCGSYAGAREKGLVRMEGKEYVVQDGDVILFRFNV